MYVAAKQVLSLKRANKEFEMKLVVCLSIGEIFLSCIVLQKETNTNKNVKLKDNGLSRLFVNSCSFHVCREKFYFPSAKVERWNCVVSSSQVADIKTQFELKVN